MCSGLGWGFLVGVEVIRRADVISNFINLKIQIPVYHDTSKDRAVACWISLVVRKEYDWKSRYPTFSLIS